MGYLYNKSAEPLNFSQFYNLQPNLTLILGCISILLGNGIGYCY